MPVKRTQSARRYWPEAGFSLLELIIALAISAILLSMAVPSMQTFLGGSALTSTTNDFVYSLQTARSEAIKRAAPVALCPSAAPMAEDPVCADTSFANGWIVFADDDGNGLRNAAEQLIRQAEPAGPGFAFAADTALSQRIWFDDSGTSTNTVGVPLSGDISISHAGSAEQRRVRVAANGRISSHVLATTEAP